MVSGFISRLVILIFGTLYPAYASYKAVRTKNVKEYVKWMMYWIVFALFTCIETFTDLFFSFWFPFYYEIKIITVIYLLSPATNGSSILYRKFVHPVLTKREQEIDEYIAKAKEQGYHTMLNLGSKGVTYATSLIMQTAIKGGGGLFNQLKKSYSLNDLSDDQRNKNSEQNFNDQVDNRYINDPRMVHRLQGYSPRHTFSGTSYPESYFSEVDEYRKPVDLNEENPYGEIPFSGISSGYSSSDSLPFNDAFKESSLVRTASLGGTNRIRTRASSKNASLKRSSLAEEGSTWSMEESHESHLDSERPFHVPWSRSMSLPFSVTSIKHLIKPEYLYLFGDLTPEQMSALVNHTYPNPIKNMCLENNHDTNKAIEIISCNSEENISNAIKKVEKDCLLPSPQIVEENNTISNSEMTFETLETEKKLDIKNRNEGITSIENNKGSERSHKYNKKPAPAPPIENSQVKPVKQGKKEEKEEEEEEDILFVTPNVSPVLEKKLKFFDCQAEKVVNVDNETCESERPKIDCLEIPKNTKNKKKSISSKLHLPKMSFSFWGQKNTKTLSESENSSIASADNVTLENESKSNNEKNGLEFFIPLKDEETHEKNSETLKEQSEDVSLKEISLEEKFN